MTYMLWLDERSSGPFSRSQVEEMLKRGEVTTKSLCCQNGPPNAGWVPLESFPDFSKPSEAKLPTAVSVANEPWSEPQRSGWASFMRVVGVVSILASLFGPTIAAAMNPDSRSNSASPFWVGIVAGVISLLTAFLIDVLTDIRWHLQELRRKR